jgi:hypothetical protein
MDQYNKSRLVCIFMALLLFMVYAPLAEAQGDRNTLNDRFSSAPAGGAITLGKGQTIIFDNTLSEVLYLWLVIRFSNAG